MKQNRQKKGGVIGGGRSILIWCIPAIVVVIGLAGKVFGGVIGGS